MFHIPIFPDTYIASPIIKITHQTGTPITTGEPTSTSHYYPRCIVYSKACSWCYLWLWINLCWHVFIIYMIQSSFTALKTLSALCILPFPLTPGNWCSFYCLHSLPSIECHLDRIRQYVVFPYWLLSLSNSDLNLCHVFSWLGILFLFSTK